VFYNMAPWCSCLRLNRIGSPRLGEEIHDRLLLLGKLIGR
jgi:hypothetical protein